MVSGDTSGEPSAMAGLCSTGLPLERLMPILSAILVTGQIPMSLISCTK